MRNFISVIEDVPILKSVRKGKNIVGNPGGRNTKLSEPWNQLVFVDTRRRQQLLASASHYPHFCLPLRSSWSSLPRTFTSFNGLNYNLLDSKSCQPVFLVFRGSSPQLLQRRRRRRRLKQRSLACSALICAMPTSNSLQYRKQAHIELMFLASKGHSSHWP